MMPKPDSPPNNRRPGRPVGILCHIVVWLLLTR